MTDSSDSCAEAAGREKSYACGGPQLAPKSPLGQVNPFTGMRRLAADSVVYGLGIALSRAFGLLLLPFYARYFTPQQYGLLDVLTATSIVVAALSELQIVSGVSREYYDAKERGELPELLGNAIVLYGIATICWTTVGCCSFVLLRRFTALSFGWPVVLPLLAGILPGQMFGLFQTLLRFEGRRGHFLMVSAGDLTTGVAAIATAVIFMGSGPLGVLWAMVCSRALWSSILLAWHWRSIHIGLSRYWTGGILRYGVPLLPAVLAKWGQTYVNRYIIAALLGVAAVGQFGVAVQLSGLVVLVDVAFQQAWAPRAMHLFGEKGSERDFARIARIYIVAMFLLATCLSITGRPLVRFMAGTKYAMAGELLGFLAFGFFWNGAGGVLSVGNAWERKTYWNGIGSGVGVLCNVGFLFWSLKRWGVMGAGVAYLLGTLIAAFVILNTAQRVHRIPYRKMELALALVGSVAVSYYVHWASRLSGWSYAVSGSLILICCMAVAFKTMPAKHAISAVARQHREKEVPE